ncbi:MAG TPA: hypothetical protein VK427_13570 [Kofleriaceae bacterium]|nr:hypothetical protein [Kofleriaceae bacterium]
MLRGTVSYTRIAAIGVGAALAVGCAGQSRPASPPTPEPATSAPVSPRAQLDELDRAITDDMAKLALPRPVPPPLTCVGDCAQQMSGAATTATAPESPSCKPAATQTCQDACTLKASICTNAGRICKIASELGGTDSYANEKCTSGNASCEAARARCCGCF